MPTQVKRQTIAIKTNWIALLVSQIVDFGLKTGDNSTKALSHPLIKNPFRNFSNDRFKEILEVAKRHKIASVMVLVVVIATVAIILRSPGKVPTALTSKTNFSPQVSVDVNRKFGVPIRNANGEPTGNNLAITVSTVDRTKRILIQGKPATARDTKAFLILNLEIENSTTNQLNVKPVDFIRLQDAGQSFAPDVHNDIVKAEPVSIKKTRVGFVVDEDKTSFEFLIGELDGNREKVEVTL